MLTNLFPHKENTMSGIFVVKRLQQLTNFGVECTVVPVGYKDSWEIRLLKRLLKKPLSIPVDGFMGTEFEKPLSRNLFTYIIGKILPCKVSDHYARELRRYLNIPIFDLIHAHGMYNPPAGEIAYFLSRKLDKPFVVTLHGSDVNLLMSKEVQRYTKALERASKVIFVSKELLKTAKSLGYSGKNGVVIPNGYDENVFKPHGKEQVRKELELHKDGYKYIGFVGNLVKIKRADKLAEIFQYVVSKLPKTQFIVVGDGPLRKKVEEDTKDLEIIFTGRQPQEMVAKYMNAMDVMILPSRKEGFGAVCIEAQACGTCVIGSNNGGIPEAIGFEEYIVEEGQDFEKRFAQKVIDVLKNGYDRQKIIERVKDYTWDNIVRHEVEIYKEILR